MTGGARVIAAALALVLAPAVAGAGPLSVPLVVKEAAGTGATAFPVSVVVPLPSGRYQDATTLRIVDDAGRAVPAQVGVLNRWWGRDRSVRHVKVEFQPTVAAFKGSGTGTATYRLVDAGPAAHPSRAVTVRDEPGRVVIETGTVTLTIDRRPFRVMTPTGPLEAVLAARQGEQRSFDRSDATVEIEEQGPMRVVVRAEAPTIYRGATHHVHGWALRLYAWAGKPFVRVDFQLQNSATTSVYTAPLYFRSLALTRPGGVAATMRWMREMGGAVTADAVQLVPPGGWVDGLYWLDDMRHVVFQTMYWFGGGANERLAQWPPVAIVPTAWYAATKATLDLGGVVPLSGPVSGADRRVPDPPDAAHTGWENFWLDVDRKVTTASGGGWPYSASRFIATESPADVFHAERMALGELNGRPQWMARYEDARDWPRLKLSTNPYAGSSWRQYQPGALGVARDKLAAPYLAGTTRRASPRDDQHGWFYHVEEAYYATGDPWIRDWYRFVAEFRHVFLEEKDPYPDRSSRGIGHALAHALQAYRVTGHPALLPKIRAYALGYLTRSLLPTGARASGYESGDRRNPPFESAFMAGFLCRALIGYLEEVGGDPEIETIVRRMVEWNVAHANFGYNVNPADPVLSAKSTGSGMIFADAEAWVGRRTGSIAIRDHLLRYVTSGIDGGQRPYAELRAWSGDFVGRLTAALLGPPSDRATAPSVAGEPSRSAAPDIAARAATAPHAPRALPAIPGRTWFDARDTRLRAVVPAYALDGSGGWPPAGIVTAWNGGALDTRRSILVLPLGGGHADWYWNNVYGFHIPTLSWERMTEATRPMPRGVDGRPLTLSVLPDGQPPARHTYGGVQYLPGVDRLWVHGGALWFLGTSDALTWLFDIEHRTWTRSTDAPTSDSGIPSAVDPATGEVIAHLGRRVFAYRPASATWRVVSRAEGHRGSWYSGVIAGRSFYVIGHGEVRRYRLDQSGPVTAEIVATMNGDTILGARSAGLEWDPALARIVAWAGGATVWLLDPETRRWTAETPGGDAPGPQPPGGTFGRFRRLPDQSLYVLVNGVDENVRFLCLEPPGSACAPPR